MTIASLALLGLATGHGCTSAGPPGVNSVAPATASGFLPAACEQREGDLYRTLVASTIEALGHPSRSE